MCCVCVFGVSSCVVCLCVVCVIECCLMIVFGSCVPMFVYVWMLCVCFTYRYSKRIRVCLLFIEYVCVI